LLTVSEFLKLAGKVVLFWTHKRAQTWHCAAKARLSLQTWFCS